MYLPTFWKLTTEAYGYKMRHLAGWGLPGALFSKLIANLDPTVIVITINQQVIVFAWRNEIAYFEMEFLFRSVLMFRFCYIVGWIGFPSFYNWTYSTIIPPPSGK